MVDLIDCGGGGRRPPRCVVAAAAAMLIALAGACSSRDTGPIVQCSAGDGHGGLWIARDINPLAAQERALIDCGEQSQLPDDCVAVGCDRQW